MNTTIWKFQLKAVAHQTVEMPKGAVVLTAQTQEKKLCLWAMVDPDAPKESVQIEVFGTGHHMPPADRLYLSTFQLEGGALVFHVFRRL